MLRFAVQGPAASCSLKGQHAMHVHTVEYGPFIKSQRASRKYAEAFFGANYVT